MEKTVKYSKFSFSGIISSSLFSLAAVLSFALGSFGCGMKMQPVYLAGSFFSSLGREFSLNNLIGGFLYILLPFAVSVLSGFDFLGSLYSFFAIFLRSFLSGYSVAACIAEKFTANTVMFILYTLVESLILIIIISSCVGQRYFRKYCFRRNENPLRSSQRNKYFSHAFFRLGILVFLYLIRCLICTFFTL